MTRAWRAGSPWMQGIVLFALAAVVAGLAGCSDDDPPECTRAVAGEFILDADPPMMEATTTFTATVTSAEYFPTPPPLWDYRLRTDEGAAIQIQVKAAAFSLPVEVDSTYTFILERHLAGNLVPSNGLKIFDGQGLRYLAVYDWLPNSTIFKDGYGNLAGDGELQVFYQDGGCPPREENTDRIKELTNYRLEFLIGDDLRAQLWHGEQAHLGRWIVGLEKAILIQAKDPQYAQNQISFFIQRDDTVQ